MYEYYTVNTCKTYSENIKTYDRTQLIYIYKNDCFYRIMPNDIFTSTITLSYLSTKIKLVFVQTILKQ